MKPLPTLLGVVSLLAGLFGAAGAQFSDRLYPIIELTDEDLEHIDLHDGSIGDWLDVIGDPVVTALDFHTLPGRDRVLYDPADLDFRIWMGWHDATDRLFVAMERVDDIYVNEYQWNGLGWTIMMHDSSLQFRVDGDHSGGQYFYYEWEVGTEGERLLLHNGQAQTYYAIGEVLDDSPLVFLQPQGLHTDWFTNPPYAEGGGGTFGENPVITATEFYVTPFDQLVWDHPEESRVSDLYPGKIIGFLIQTYDYEIGHNPESVHTLAGPGFDLRIDPSGIDAFSDIFADGILVGPNGEVPEGTAVQDMTWGRIKATFQPSPVDGQRDPVTQR